MQKDFFDAIGFLEDQYQGPDVFSKLKMVVNGQAMYGLFTGLLLYMMLYGSWFALICLLIC